MSGATDELSFTALGLDLFLTVTNADGTGAVTAISGTVDGMAVTGLDVSFDAPDNTVVSTAFPQFDANGLSFDTASDQFNIFASGDELNIIDANNNVDLFVSSDVFTVTPLCYLRGTRILTPTGQIRVEDLRIGDRVVTRFGGIQAVKWIGRQCYYKRFLSKNSAKLPVRIKAGALGESLPAHDLYVSPGHSMLVGDALVLASALVNGVTITREDRAADQERLDYFQPELESHDCILAEGTWSETFADGPGLRAAYHNAAEFHRLYPAYETPSEIRLCAPRPERGVALQAALRPVVDRACANLAPGPLLGSLDRVAEQVVEGWALDADHPEMPVLLEVLIDGEVIHQGLSCDFRADLQQAGYANGRCAFSFTLPHPVHNSLPGRIVVRRASCGMAVQPASALAA